MWKLFYEDDTCFEPEESGNYSTKREAKAELNRCISEYLKDYPKCKISSYEKGDTIAKTVFLPNGEDISFAIEEFPNEERRVTSISRDRCGNYVATIYDPETESYEDQTFMWYTKKEVIYLLRHKYDAIVGREFC